MSKYNPTVVFIPGSWHTPSHFEPLISALATHQINSTCVSLPSNSAAHSKDIEFEDDVAAVREIVGSLVLDEEKEVIVVMHSYGGMVGSEATQGLSVKERTQASRHGGISRLIYIAALILPEGTQVAARGDMSKVPSWAEIDEDRTSLRVIPTEAKRIFYNDLPELEASKWTSNLVPQSYKVWWTPTTYAAWRYIPSIGIIAADDNAAPFAGFMLKAAQENKPSMIETLETVQGGHSPMLSNVEWIVDVLKRVVGNHVNTGT